MDIGAHLSSSQKAAKVKSTLVADGPRAQVWSDLVSQAALLAPSAIHAMP